MSDEQRAKWQARLDHSFPRGMVASWDKEGARTTYLVPRVVVVEMSGLDPVVWLDAYSGSDKTLGPYRVTSYVEHRSGWHRQVEVTFDGIPHPMCWNAGVSRRAARVMNPERIRLLTLAPQGGEAVLHDPLEGGADNEGTHVQH